MSMKNSSRVIVIESIKFHHITASSLHYFRTWATDTNIVELENILKMNPCTCTYSFLFFLVMWIAVNGLPLCQLTEDLDSSRKISGVQAKVQFVGLYILVFMWCAQHFNARTLPMSFHFIGQNVIGTCALAWRLLRMRIRWSHLSLVAPLYLSSHLSSISGVGHKRVTAYVILVKTHMLSENAILFVILLYHFINHINWHSIMG